MMNALATTHTLFQAFAEPTRLRLLNLLTEGELCVCELCEVLEVLQPSISRHLAYLQRAGLVNARREGKWKHYSLVRQPTGIHRTLLHCVRTCLRELDVLNEDLDRLKAVRERGCLKSERRTHD